LQGIAVTHFKATGFGVPAVFSAKQHIPHLGEALMANGT
jgi:hypothetical protein